jgi:hypothetical protein
MNWFGSGFIPILIYSNSIAVDALQQYALITETTNLNIRTEISQDIYIEAE